MGFMAASRLTEHTLGMRAEVVCVFFFIYLSFCHCWIVQYTYTHILDTELKRISPWAKQIVFDLPK
jgi:hypothetical protein